MTFEFFSISTLVLAHQKLSDEMQSGVCTFIEIDSDTYWSNQPYCFHSSPIILNGGKRISEQ